MAVVQRPPVSDVVQFDVSQNFVPAGVLSDDGGAGYANNLGPKLGWEALYQFTLGMMKAPTG